MNYVVKKNGRVLKSLGQHTSYERARQAARRYIRKLFSRFEYEQHTYGVWDSISRNPTSIAAAGLKITKA